MAKPYFRKDTRTWYVRNGKEKIRVGKDKKSAEHLARKINIQNAEGAAGIHRLHEKGIKAFFTETIAF